jgi:hypothetical protein
MHSKNSIFTALFSGVNFDSDFSWQGMNNFHDNVFVILLTGQYENYSQRAIKPSNKISDRVIIAYNEKVRTICSSLDFNNDLENLNIDQSEDNAVFTEFVKKLDNYHPVYQVNSCQGTMKLYLLPSKDVEL